MNTLNTRMIAPILRVVCSWCTRVLVEGDPGAKVSHGLCDVCRDRLEKEVA